MFPRPPSPGSPASHPPGEQLMRDRADVPVLAGPIAVVLQDRSPDAPTIDLEETRQALAAPQHPMP